MFEQIPTYQLFGQAEINGVLNFKVEDVSYFHVSKGSEYAVLLIKGSAVYYTVLYGDLKKILDKR